VTDAAAIFLNGVAAGASRKLNRPFLGLSTSDSTCGDHAGKNARIVVSPSVSAMSHH
jgi:hypothetical protein